MIVMHGLFDLKDEVAEGDFQTAFQNFCEHLKEIDFAVSGRLMRRQPHPGYDARPPKVQHYVAVEFSDMEQAERCWSYLELNDEPVKSIHDAVTRKVRDASFFLNTDV